MTMTDEEYRAWALEEHARREAARINSEIEGLIGQRKHAEERAEIHQRLCARHRLDPTAASLRQVADAEIAYAHGWRSHVANRFGGSAHAGAVLDPENAAYGDARRPASVEEVEKYRSGLTVQRDKLRREFEASWPPADLAERLSATDGVAAHYGHSTGIAA